MSIDRSSKNPIVVGGITAAQKVIASVAPVSLSSTDNHVIRTKDLSIKQLTCNDNGHVYYLSGSVLYKVNLK
ncbi:MAG: hypothetical protein ACYC27_17530 [Armatimonadota bacterium]